LIWQANSTNLLGQYDNVALGDGNTTQKIFTNFGLPVSFNAGSNVFNMDFSFDNTNGNLIFRTDHFNGTDLSEVFGYTDNNDKLNRLTSVTGPQNMNITYQPNGNISTKTDLGNYSYNSAKPNAVETIDNPGGLISTNQQDIGYTSFDKANIITENNNILSITYGPDQERVEANLVNSNTGPISTIYYAESYEKEVKGSNTIETNYITGGDGLCAIYVVTNGVGAMYYVYKDHLGSILTITNDQGQVVGRQSFDAWGNARNASNWTSSQQTTLNMPAWLHLGYAGHEHLPQFGLINMNGRMYDPIISRMLRPDNFVPDATSTQSFNRYAYCFNNPLKYVDPDGNSPAATAATTATRPPGTPMMWAAATFLVGATADHLLNYNYYGHDNIGEAFKAGFDDAFRAFTVINSLSQIPVYNKNGLVITAGPAFAGCGVAGSVSYTSGDWTFSVGGGAFSYGYNVGGGISYYDRPHDQRFSLFYSHFGKRSGFFGNSIGSQNTAGIGYQRKDFSLRTDNDIFALEGNDRWRTGSLEMGWKSFVWGFRMYENDPKNEAIAKGLDPYSSDAIDYDGTNLAGKLNRPASPTVGAWKEGYVYQSPMYIGYRFGTTVLGVGINHPLVQDKTQNPIHRWVSFGRQNYYNNYSKFEGQGFWGGEWTYNPFSPYGHW